MCVAPYRLPLGAEGELGVAVEGGLLEELVVGDGGEERRDQGEDAHLLPHEVHA